MQKAPFSFQKHRPDDHRLISQLCTTVFGPGRFARTAYRIREGASRDNGFHITAWDNEHLAGAVSFTHVKIGGVQNAYLLGPLCVHPDFLKRSCGLQLIEAGKREVIDQGGHIILLVGDLPYYSRLDFIPIPSGQICLPGPVDLNRLLGFECMHNALQDYQGLVKAL